MDQDCRYRRAVAPLVAARSPLPTTLTKDIRAKHNPGWSRGTRFIVSVQLGPAIRAGTHDRLPSVRRQSAAAKQSIPVRLVHPAARLRPPGTLIFGWTPWMRFEYLRCRNATPREWGTFTPVQRRHGGRHRDIRPFFSPTLLVSVASRPLFLFPVAHRQRRRLDAVRRHGVPQAEALRR